MNKSELQNDRDLKVFFIKYFKIIFILSFFPHCIDTIRGGECHPSTEKSYFGEIIKREIKVISPDQKLGIKKLKII